MQTVNVIGLGYIGLPTAVLLADAGHQVLGVDIQEKVVQKLNAGQAHFEEKGLQQSLKKALDSGRFKASTTVQSADIHLIIVPTPFIVADKSADMSYVQNASKTLAQTLKAGDLVVLESTSGLGATRVDVQQVVEAQRPDLVGKVHYAFCPERAIPGNTLYELIHNDRVIGGTTPEATEKAYEFYQTFIKGQLLKSTDQVAEMVKLCENAFRDVNIAYANELSMICDELGINVWDVIRLANHHPRVNILQPGPGVGGHCIAIDPWFIAAASKKGNAKLITQARQVNDAKPEWVVAKVAEAVAQSAEEKPTVGLMGLAFKPNVDDMRESPALKVAQMVQKTISANILACEPYLKELAGFHLVNTEELLEKADILVMLTDHDIFKQLNKEQLANKTIIDTRGAFTHVF
ncbi:MAG: UDP-N-acetyl-D-mannosamine dehydrogenase [Pseudomonadota bacterium]|nr:UDP-N-acetyl-D-mannosamine dehydrogenase [Pseudomonadota bacterium]